MFSSSPRRSYKPSELRAGMYAWADTVYSWQITLFLTGHHVILAFGAPQSYGHERLKVDGNSRMNSSHSNVYDGKECVVVSAYLHVVILIASNLSP